MAQIQFNQLLKIKNDGLVFYGLSDNLEDFKSVIEIMKILRCPHLTISRDTSKKYSIAHEESKALIEAAGYLVALLSKNNLGLDMFTYTPEEREKAIECAKKLIANKMI